MKVFNVGLASYGLSGQVFHGPLLHMQPGFHIMSILERNSNNSANHYPEAEIVRTFDELLENEKIDLIIVNLPDPFHFEMTRKALQAGKNVVVEKPFVKNSQEGKELIDLAGKQNLLLSVFQNRRWDGDFLTVRQILKEGLLGRLVEYEAHFDRCRNVVQENTWKEESGSGSTIYNLGSHLIDQAMVLFGKPKNVFADIRIQRDRGKVDDAFTILLGYPGIKVTLKSSYLVKEAGPRYYLHGTKGSFLKSGIDPQEEALKNGELPAGEDWGKEPASEWGILNIDVPLNNKNKPAGRSDGLSSPGNTKTIRDYYETLPGRYTAYYEDIYECLLSGKAPEVSADQANLVIRIIEAALESNQSGCRVKIR